MTLSPNSQQPGQLGVRKASLPFNYPYLFLHSAKQTAKFRFNFYQILRDSLVAAAAMEGAADLTLGNVPQITRISRIIKAQNQKER
ncbi:hypothetical protein FGO68_gene2080 [Halteria grandinella]|uniref:Uncharacterized protein n=1 Tax=Halteria grandinella TaxID=5974 RepID=A0A8J8SVN7_HALGN|nr:hypothetical protein FGO68_gene2080 [Halteria grandinella]